MNTLLSTTDVLQAAAGTARIVVGLAPLFPRAAICAPAATCACAPGDNLALHRALLGAPAGSALVCSAGGNSEVGHFGELMALDAGAQDLAGLLIDGAVRDSVPVAELGFAVFHIGLAPAAAVKKRTGSVGEPVELCGTPIAPGDQIVADRDAVLVVPCDDWPAVELAANEIRAREVTMRGQIARGRRLAELLSLPDEEAR